MTELFISGGTVFTPDGPRETNIHVTDGVITGVREGRPIPAGAKVIDATGLYVLPGGIDVHVHSRDPGFPDKEDFGTLTAAAAAGGVTTVIDMPNTVPAVDSAGVLESKAARARSRSRVDFGLWALIRFTSTPEQLAELAAAGATGFKAYLGYSFSLSRKQVMPSIAPDDPDLEPPPDYGTLTRLAPAVADLGLPLLVHAEDAGILHAFSRPLESYTDLLNARPSEAEAVAISAATSVAHQYGLRMHITHLSSAQGRAAAQEAIAAGVDLSVETCPHYLWLSEADFERLGTAMKINPPVRTQADRSALRAGLTEGLITIVATDHAPHTDEEKARGLDAAPPGSPGVQTLYLSCLELAHQLGDVWMAPRWVSEAPAELAGLGESKGRIAPGYDADLVIVDPKRGTTFSPRMMRSRQRHGALNGLTSSFSIRSVYLRGTQVFNRGRLSTNATGRMVRPSPARP